MGIRVSAVSPGWFRTSFAKEESVALSEQRLPDYEHISNAHEKFKSMDGKQIGNPDKVAAVFMKLVNDPNPPILLFMGSDAYDSASAKIDDLIENMKIFKSLSVLTDF